MNQTNQVNQLQTRVSPNNFAFFVHNSNTPFDPETGIQFSFENWKNGTVNMRLCKVVDCEPIGLETFLTSQKSVYSYCECVQVPINSTTTIDEINSQIATPKTFETSIEKENRELKQRLAELESRLDNASIPPAKKKSK